jgi:hypothetical protein
MTPIFSGPSLGQEKPEIEGLIPLFVHSIGKASKSGLFGYSTHIVERLILRPYENAPATARL